MIRSRSLLVALVLSVAVPGLARADAYQLDPAHSQVGFKVKHLGISTVTGLFETYSGTFEFDPQKIETGKVSVTINVASINTNVEDRDKHLRSPDFFDVEKFPEMTFQSTKIQNVAGNVFQVVGDLTIHGVTKSVVLETELGGTVTDPWGNQRAAFTASTKINRKDFGLTWNNVLETGGLVVGDEVRILIEVEGIKAKG